MATESGGPTAELLDGLVQTSFAITARLSAPAAAHELSLTQLRTLAILRDGEPQMADLAGFLGLDRSSVSGLVDRAEKRGLVRRTSSVEDGRAVRVSLTAQGRRLARRVTAEVGGLVSPMTDVLSPADQKRLATLLSRLIGQPG